MSYYCLLKTKIAQSFLYFELFFIKYLSRYRSHESPIQLGFTLGSLMSFSRIERWYNWQPTHMPKTDSKNSSKRHTRQSIQTGPKYVTSLTKNKDKINMVTDKPKPKLQAKRFCIAPIHNGLWLYVIIRDNNAVGENLGLINTPIKKLNTKNPDI